MNTIWSFLAKKEAAQARPSQHLSKYHIVGNHMSRLNYNCQLYVIDGINLSLYDRRVCRNELAPYLHIEDATSTFCIGGSRLGDGIGLSL